MNGIDHVAFTGKPHLTPKGKDETYCGKTAPFWYRVSWNGKSEGVCKNCIKKVVAAALKEQKETAAL